MLMLCDQMLNWVRAEVTKLDFEIDIKRSDSGYDKRK